MTATFNRSAQVLERPLSLSSTDVRLVLAGQKTQLRAPLRLQPHWVAPIGKPGHWHYTAPWGSGPFDPEEWAAEDTAGYGPGAECPFGMVGDHLWVRESCTIATHLDSGLEVQSVYRLADGVRHEGVATTKARDMPRWASRMSLRVTTRRVQRLHDISAADARAEGVHGRASERRRVSALDRQCLANFRARWTHQRNQAPYRWEDNPFVWAVTVERVEQAANDFRMQSFEESLAELRRRVP